MNNTEDIFFNFSREKKELEEELARAHLVRPLSRRVMKIESVKGKMELLERIFGE